jgi:hypothetical protein
MKRLSVTLLLLGALVVVLPARPATAQVQASVSIGGFYDELSPYGRWVGCRYGQCWIPQHVSADWQPYTNGQWVYTEYGWTWMSEDPWGGNPYHYGTWTSLGRQGWCWVPGTVWAPAWVTWSYSDRYVGWAPLPPSLSFGASGYSGRAIVLNSAQYVFVPTNRFVGVSVNTSRVSAGQNAAIFRQTRPVTRFAVSGGIVRNTAIPMATIQRAGGARIETRSIQDARTNARPMMSVGRGRRVGIVAPAREVNSAFAAHSRGPSRSAASAGEKNKDNVRPGPGHDASRHGSDNGSRGNGKSRSDHGVASGHERAAPEKRSASAHERSQPRHESATPPGRVEGRPETHRQAAPAQRHSEQPDRIRTSKESHGPQGKVQADSRNHGPKGKKDAEKGSGEEKR